VSDKARCPRGGCNHYQWNHKTELRGPWNTSEHVGRCAIGGCECPAWDTSVEDAQRRFAHEWKQRNALRVYGPTWMCPLCERVLQEVIHNGQLAGDIERHQSMVHGQDWLDYQQSGRAAQSRQEGEGDG